MLDQLHPLALQLDASAALLERALADFPADAWVSRFGEESTNHAAFIALHLLDARCFLVRSTGVEMHHAFEALAEDARRLEDITRYPEAHEILEDWRKAAATTRPALEALTAADLASPSPQRFPIDDETMLGLVAFLAQHEAYHVGQLGMIRRAQGLSPLFGGGPA